MRYVLLLAAAAWLFVGCSPPDPRSRSFTVSGTVTFDGQPVADGGITLFPNDPTLAADAGSITNGTFRFLASAGRKQVQIRASREVPYRGPPNVPYNPVFAEYIPARFNEKSELTIEVVPGAENRFDFPLTAK